MGLLQTCFTFFTSIQPFRNPKLIHLLRVICRDTIHPESQNSLSVMGFMAGVWITTVYNLRVADHYTYFVGGDLWGWEVWAHNVNRILSERTPHMHSW